MENESVRGQITTPILLGKVLPVGFMGLFCAAMLYAFISTHDTFLHSWGSILVQDVLMPLRKKPPTPKQHMRWLKYSIFGVAVFAFLWSAFLRFDEYILWYWAITGSIFLGGSGAVIIGGLYWKRGTTAAAYSALIVGAILAGGGLIWRYIDPDIMPSYYFALLSMGGSVTVYVLVSLLGSKTCFNMDQMLHRGKYAIEDDIVKASKEPRKRWKKIFGITNEFTRFDIFIYMLTVAYTFIMAAVAIGLAVCYFVGPKFGFIFNDRSWVKFWGYYLCVQFGMSVIFVTWIVIGGAINVKQMFKILKIAKRSDLDDGRVVGHHSLADEELVHTALDENKDE